MCTAREVASPSTAAGGGIGGLMSGAWAGGGANPVTGAADAKPDRVDRFAALAASTASNPAPTPASTSAVTASPVDCAAINADSVVAPVLSRSAAPRDAGSAPSAGWT